MTDTSPRDLIQQLAGLARRKHYTCEDSWYNCPKSEDGSANDYAGTECDCGADEHNAKVDAICAYLAQPEPEVPTDEEILALSQEHGVSYTTLNGGVIYGRREGYDMRDDVLSLARAVLARWGRPSIEPVPVSERLPTEADCDAERMCWWWHPDHKEDEFTDGWMLLKPEWAGGHHDTDDSPSYTHWLPHWAMPIPTQHS
jgi:hypothetical protein